MIIQARVFVQGIVFVLGLLLMVGGIATGLHGGTVIGLVGAAVSFGIWQRWSQA